MALPRWSKALSHTSINFVWSSPRQPTSRRNERVSGKVVPRQDSGTGGGSGKIVRLTQNYGLKTTSKNMLPAFVCQSHVANLEYVFGSRSSRWLQMAQHAYKKCIASGQQKRSVGQALFVCGDVANINARADYTDILRNATTIAIVTATTVNPSPRRKQQLQYFIQCNNNKTSMADLWLPISVVNAC